MTNSKSCARYITSGHNLSECKKPRDRVCFKCGIKGFKVTDCRKCSPSNNKKN